MRHTLQMRNRILITLGLISVAGAVAACEPRPAQTDSNSNLSEPTLVADGSASGATTDGSGSGVAPDGDGSGAVADGSGAAADGSGNEQPTTLPADDPALPIGGQPHDFGFGDGPMGGRPMRDQGAPVLAPLRPRHDWSHRASLRTNDAGLSDPQRQWIVDKWQRDAQFEHSSVASFARTALDLLALGAPPELVAGCNQAAIDEIRHAQACFGVAATLSGHPVGPGPIDVPSHREVTLADVAVEAFTEGCAGEAFAVLSMHRALARGASADIDQILRDICEDEMTHALLGWQIVAWALKQDPSSVLPALETAASKLGASLLATQATESSDGDEDVPPDALLRQYGCLPPAMYASVHQDAWNETIVPALDALLDQFRSA